MSLIRQLWIAIGVVMALSLGGSLVVSTLSARHYLEQQLQVKNLDNATALALSLTQMPKDPVTVELLIAAQFDAGHYRAIRLIAPGGRVIVEREFANPAPGAPSWFTRLVPIDAAPGIAQVQDGWRQFGTLTLESHSRYAYQALWQGVLQLMAWFLAGGAILGVIGTLVVRRIMRPLDGVVEQAEAIGARRFISAPEPATPEFRAVVRAMNALSGRVRAMLGEESERLETLRRETQHDPLTGLLNRGPFLDRLDSALARDDAAASGVLLIARVGALGELNHRLGHEGADRLLQSLSHSFSEFAAPYGDWTVGRLNGSDLALLATGIQPLPGLAEDLARALHAAADAAAPAERVAIAVGAGCYAAGEPHSQVLARVDRALAAAESAGERAIRVAPQPDTPSAGEDAGDWRVALLAGLDGEGVRLGRYAVVASDGGLLHREAPARLKLRGKWQTAGHFVPWAARLGLMPRLDAAVASAALEAIRSEGMPLGINLAPESLLDADFRAALLGALSAAPEQARRLWIELPEHGALDHLVEFRALCQVLRPLGCKLGVDHVGLRFARVADLHDLGLDYIKTDAALTRGIDRNSGNQAFLRGLCTLAHSIGLIVIAEGVANAAELRRLPELGVDGMTGPAVNLPHAQE